MWPFTYYKEEKSYEELLREPLWFNRRMQILRRDSFCCQHCGCHSVKPKINEPYNLNIHHKFYVLDYPIWKYPDDALITLCHNCHIEEHRRNKIPIYNQMPQKGEKPYFFNPSVCSRCNGRGFLPEYRHIDGGRCFKCGGCGCDNMPRETVIVGYVDHTKIGEDYTIGMLSDTTETPEEKAARLRAELEAIGV